MADDRQKAGFSLVELSIVVVILGLLTGGILTGQNLIRAAELRSVTTELQKYSAAIYTFRDKYFALPGDMRNATDFWGRSNIAANNCLTQPGTASADGTCNGNGDGYITYSSPPAEQMTFLHHLRLAGMLSDGQMSSLDPANPLSGRIATPGMASGTQSWVGGCDSVTGGCSAGNRNADLYSWLPGGSDAKGNAIQTSKVLSVLPHYIAAAIAVPEEVWNIDKKIDDGLPASGIFRGMDGLLTTDGSVYLPCVDTSGSQLAYNLSYESEACRFLLLIR